jgi:acetyltransferase-like isoleucine patch superfamily enzyme
MPNKFIGGLVYVYYKIKDTVSLYFNDNMISYLVKNIETPFCIEKGVVLRTPNQIKIEKDCTIKTRTIINGRSRNNDFGIILGENTYLKENCYFDAYGSGFIHIEGFCAFGQNTIIHGGGGVKIGKYVITGANCYIIASNHLYNSIEFPIMLQGDKRIGIVIEDNVWIGGSVIVLDGVTIGKNSVIAAGTVVSKNVPPNTLMYNKNNLIFKTIYNEKSN